MDGPCKPLYKKCSILGLGLMGGSLGMALGKYRVVEERWGYDINRQAARDAVRSGAVDQAADDLPQTLADAELVILAMPVQQIIKMLKMITPYLQKGALVTDLGSTKQKIVKAMEDVLPPGVTGIGGHPMAGSEQAGIAAADPLLLDDAVYLLTPTSRTPAAALQELQDAVLAVRARPVIINGEVHDRITALVSHLPQLVAAALVNALTNSGLSDNLLFSLAGKGFRDTTRIAMGESEMWYDIFHTNKPFLKQSLQYFLSELHYLHDCLENEDEQGAKTKLTQAGLIRKSMNKR